MTFSKLLIVYSMVYCTSLWCHADIIDITTLMTSNYETDSDISATGLDDYNATTAPTPAMTTINEYYSVSGSTLPRDRMGTVNSHYHSHKDRPKSEEVIFNHSLVILHRLTSFSRTTRTGVRCSVLTTP